jgi:hypothetical protein
MSPPLRSTIEAGRWLGGLSLVLLFAHAGCTFDQAGTPPPPATLNYPIAIGLSAAAPGEEPSHLFVANSNFDLRFNEATLMAFDLSVVEQLILECEARTEADPCIITDLAPVLSHEVGIGSHADALAVSPDGGRLYLPVRSTRSLTFVDWDGARFGSVSPPRCDEEIQDSNITRCGEESRAGLGAVATEREVLLEGDPIDVAVGRLEDVGGPPGSGDFVLMATREGRVGLFLDQGEPELIDVADGFPPSAVTLTLQPGTGIAWMSNVGVRDLGRVAVAADPVDPARSFLFDFGRVRLGGVDDAQDTRDIRFDPAAPQTRAFVLARRPESVVELDLTRPGLTALDVAVGELYEIGAGPSRLAVGKVGGRTYAFATSFDARKLFVVDADYGSLVSVLGGFSGPFEMALDADRVIAGESWPLLHVVDFTTSVVRVVDLQPLLRGEPARLLMTLGEPTPVETFAQ